ncbi:hypothetical protein EJB05_48684, partial [Eragrostis curvula]
LESVAGGEVLRCRVKTTWTPPDSAADFSLVLPDAAAAPESYSKRRRGGAPAVFRAAPPPDERARPHAFVHLARPDAAHRAAAGSGLLVQAPSERNGSGPLCRLVRRGRRTTSWPPGAALWPLGHVSTFNFDEATRLLFYQDAAFAFPGTSSEASVVLTCDIKLEFYLLGRGLAVPPALCRAAGLLPHGGRQRLRVGARAPDLDDHLWVCTDHQRHPRRRDEALAYFKERVPVVVCDSGLTVHDEPEFRRANAGLFLTGQHDQEAARVRNPWIPPARRATRGTRRRQRAGPRGAAMASCGAGARAARHNGAARHRGEEGDGEEQDAALGLGDWS